MATIDMSKTNLNSGAARAKSVFEDADTNGTGVVYPAEIEGFEGKGKAQLMKVYAYARHIEGGSDGDDYVKLSTVKKALKKLNSAQKKVADTKGNKDGRLQGSELKYLSPAAAALARFTWATR